MARSLTVRNLYDKKYIMFAFDGLFQRAMGTPETTGAWILYGAEKNGKTWFAIKLAEYLSRFAKVLYISAEEGLCKDFQDTCKRAGIADNNSQLHFEEYISIEELEVKLNSRKGPSVVFIDNLTIYTDELKGGAFRKLVKKYDNKLFVFIAHEEKGEPYTATAKLCRKLSKIIMRAVGLTVSISGRCPGGSISIDEEKAALYWGEPLNN